MMVTVPRLGIAAALLAVACGVCIAQQAQIPSAPVTLFQNVRVFDGKSGALSGPTNVLVKGHTVARISADPIAIEPDARTTVIAGNGRTLMPGLIDNHWHTMLVRPTPPMLMTSDLGYLTLLAGAEATTTLMRGFTTVRDVGGPSFALKRAIDEGVIAGPRIFPSGAILTVTSGHGDFREPIDLPRVIGGPPVRQEALGASIVTDTPDEVRIRAREQLMQGASHIKLTAGGGVASPHSPLDVATFTTPELRAAVEAAENWGTYVTVHAYTPETIRRSVEAGVKVIEHGHLMDEPTARLLAERGIWLSIQPFPPQMADVFPPGSDERLKFQEVLAGQDVAYNLAKKYKIKTAFGTDVLFSQALAEQQGALLASLTRYYTPAEVLVMATGTNAELLKLSGKRSPYRGKLGVVEEGALADLLLVDGNPVENINLIADPGRNFVVIMKDGTVYKNTLPR
jgi:imidazolonepropionase-like amidohydrolase